MFIQTETTPDPASLRFLPGCEVLPDGPLEIRDGSEAALSPLPRRLFRIAGVAALTLGPDYITVTKRDGDWRHLKPALLAAIGDHFASGAPVLADTAARGAAGGEEHPLAARVREALRQVIDPELGCNIVDLGLVYDIAVTGDGVVSITMTTTTTGCPATGYLVEGTRECTAGVDGVGGVEVHLTYEPEWSHELMSSEAKALLGISD